MGSNDHHRWNFSALHQTDIQTRKGLKILTGKKEKKNPLVWDALYSHSQMGFPFVYQQFRFFFLKKEIICKQHFNRRQRLGFWVHRKKKKDLFQVTVSTATFNFIPHVSIWLIRCFTTFIYNEMFCSWEIKKLISQGKKYNIFCIYSQLHMHIEKHTCIAT